MARELKNQAEWLLAETLCGERHGIPPIADGCDQCRADVVRLVDGDAAPVPEVMDRIKWVLGMTLIAEDTGIRPASLSYVKPSEYKQQVDALLLALLEWAAGMKGGAK